LDLKLADLHQRHGFPATFFVPISNREGLPVMPGSQLRELAKSGFEVGSHTIDHCYLTTVDLETAQHQITDGKKQLEQLLGEAVPGFCYPGGKFRAEHKEMVKNANFRYARGTVNLHSNILPDAFTMPVSLQCYPHSSSVVFRNFVRYGTWTQRTAMLVTALTEKKLIDRLKASLNLVCTIGGVFHLWGHSWELDSFGGWQILDEFLAYAAERIPDANRLTNLDVLRHRSLLK
jgi:peptidoglycan/xylan/chitin deacetylase (PgdA/CDA1 family)